MVIEKNNHWTIWPTSMGNVHDVEKSNFTYAQNYGEKITLTSLVYLLKGGPKLILLDTGMSDPDWAQQYHSPSSREKFQEPLTALANLQVTPEEIDIVILTHLHWDHCFNISLFPNSRIIVQKDEVQYALFPLPIHNIYYEALSMGMTPVWLKDISRLEIVDGDLEVVPGVSIVKLPGHTPGFQGVNIKTEKGYHLIAGDLCPLFENWPDMDKEPIPPGIHVNLVDCYDSYRKARAFAQLILPGHDMKVLEYESFPIR